MSTPDFERYRRLVDEIDAPQAQKDEIIRVVWRIMQHFIDRAFGILPAQKITRIFQENSSISATDRAIIRRQSAKVKQAKPTGLTGGPR